MSGWTNRGKAYILRNFHRNYAICVAGFYVALVKSTPDPDTNYITDLTEIATGNGYTSGGQLVTQDASGFDVWIEDDTNDRAYVQMADVVWTASGGPIPSDSVGATYLVITDDIGPASARYLFHYNSLGGTRVVSDGQSLTLQNIEIEIVE